MNDFSDMSISDLGSVPPVSRAEERRLAQIMVAGREAEQRLNPNLPKDDRQRLIDAIESGQAARRRLIEVNGRLVISMAARYRRSSRAPLTDLCQEGMLGLIRAVDKFEPARGTKLSTYAVWWIRQAISRYLAGQRFIRLPVHQSDQLARIRRVEIEIAAEGGEVTAAEIAARTGNTVKNVEKLKQWEYEPLSMDAPVGEEGSDSLGDFLGGTGMTEAEAEIGLERARIEQLLDRYLTAREARILRLRYGFATGEAMTLDRIAGKFGLTRERVRQIEHSALEKLRDPKIVQLLKPDS